ncbi:MAG: MBL fold metallo-hydrolase [Candidatus Marinimicrobia bacterium]|nr:MBL fold metallo-hydrolase [Candidatus Neomarinimicrobiota bacterium]
MKGWLKNLMFNSFKNRWKIKIIETGTFKLDGGAMMGSVPKVLWDKTNPSDDLNRINLSMRCLLLDNGSDIVLIETGIGNKNNQKFIDMFCINQSSFPLKHELNRHGYSLKDITHVILTHLHFDHAGGATYFDGNNNLPTFPNAEYIISKSNWEAGIKPSPKDRASYLFENFIPIKEKNQLRLVGDNEEIMDTIHGLAFYGHTTGQQLIKITVDNDSLVFCSDLIPLKSHLKIPWIMGYDLNAMKTLEEKTFFLEEASKNKWLLFFYHDPKTAAVRIEKDKKYYKIIEEHFAK